ncbi:hypothetical protein HR45_06725 [Shewanella mangrovi]|uniref:Flagellar protein FliT n=1 Tax=Shewanella mangrovi TaxID=1515746 RepID=A0A094LSM4_9GAMM|nr:hypothetical protein [Shewanella mangrovi]KFZ38188.1 hypothetical protein HR45_06725 [Shewanella mangrovi]
MSTEEGKQLLLAQQVQALLSAMKLAVTKRQWHQLRMLDGELTALSQQLASPEFSALAQRLKPVLQHHYRSILQQLESEQNQVKQKMEQHLRDQEGIKAYQTSMDGQSW